MKKFERMGKNVGNEGRPDKPDRKNEYLRGSYRKAPKVTLNGKPIDDLLGMATKVNLTKEVGHADKVEIECYGVVDAEVNACVATLSVINPCNGKAYDKKYLLLAEKNAPSMVDLSFDVIYRALESAREHEKEGNQKYYDDYDRELEKIDKILWKEE